MARDNNLLGQTLATLLYKRLVGMIFTIMIPRSLGGGGGAGVTAALVVALLCGVGCSEPHSSSSSNSCGLFFGVDAFTVPSPAAPRATAAAAAGPLYSSYLDSISSSVVLAGKKTSSYSPSSSSSKSSPGGALPPNFRSFSPSERTERKLRGTLGQLSIREDHLQSLISDDVDYDTPELGSDMGLNRGDVEATLGRLVTSALSTINTYLPDDSIYDGRSDDGKLLREWLSDPTNVRSLSRRAHFDIAIGGLGLPDDDRKGYGDISAEERQIGKWTAYLTDPAVSKAMVNMALDDKFTYYPDDFAAGDISDEYRVLSSLKDYLTDPSSARALIATALDSIHTVLPDDSPFSQGDDADKVMRQWLDADPDNARRALIRFAMDDKLGYLSDDMSSNAALPGYENVESLLSRYVQDPTTFSGPNSKASRAFASGGASTVLSDDAIVGEELMRALSSYLNDPTNVQRLAGFGGGPSLDSDDSRFLPGYESVDKVLSRYVQDPTLTGALFGGASDQKITYLPDDDQRSLGDMPARSLPDPTTPSKAASTVAYRTGMETPKGHAFFYGSGGNKRVSSSAGNDQLTLLPDDKFYLPGYESPNDTLGRYASDPTSTVRAKTDGNSGLEIPKRPYYYY